MVEREKTCLIAANPKIRTTSAKNVNYQTTIFYVIKQMNDLPIFYFQRCQQEMQSFRDHFELVDDKQ